MATVGDSRAFLASKKSNSYSVALTTEDHKPENKAETERIEATGGVVMALKDADGSDFGPKRVWNKQMTAPGLAMSRSIGDTMGTPLGVIAKPDIVKKTLDGEDAFVLICSDGVFEFLSNENVLDIMLPYYRSNDLVGGCVKLVEQSTLEWKKVIF